APKSPATGSQICVCQKFRPNFWIDIHASWVRTNAIAPTINRTIDAKAPVPTRNPRSFPAIFIHLRWGLLPARSCADASLAPRTVALARHARRRVCPCRSLRRLHFGQRGRFKLDDRLGQRRVTKLRAVLLPVGQRPFHEVDHDLRLRL